LRTVDVECVGDVRDGASTELGADIVRVRIAMRWEVEDFMARALPSRWRVVYIVGGGREGCAED